MTFGKFAGGRQNANDSGPSGTLLQIIGATSLIGNNICQWWSVTHWQWSATHQLQLVTGWLSLLTIGLCWMFHGGMGFFCCWPLATVANTNSAMTDRSQQVVSHCWWVFQSLPIIHSDNLDGCPSRKCPNGKKNRFCLRSHVETDHCANPKRGGKRGSRFTLRSCCLKVLSRICSS